MLPLSISQASIHSISAPIRKYHNKSKIQNDSITPLIKQIPGLLLTVG
jgi:hypothetical protein